MPSDEGGRVLAALGDDDHVLGQIGKCRRGEVGPAARHVDVPVGAGRASCFLARLRDRFARDATGVDDGDIRVAVPFEVSVREQSLTHVVRVDVRDLAPQEANGEARHWSEC